MSDDVLRVLTCTEKCSATIVTGVNLLVEALTLSFVCFQAGEKMSVYIHCPYNKCGVAFRRCVCIILPIG